jgi:hypothetical protein
VKEEASSFPAAAVQNWFETTVMFHSTAALNNGVYTNSAGPTGQPADLGFSFVGNSVTGGRQAILSLTDNTYQQTNAASLLVSGNEVAPAPPLPVSPNIDRYGAVVKLWWTDRLVLSGNTVTGDGNGLWISKVCSNALVLANDFSAAKQLSLEDWGVGAVSVAAVKNKLGNGVEQHHLRGLMPEGAYHFMLGNTYVNTNGTAVNLQLEPLALPAHIQP